MPTLTCENCGAPLEYEEGAKAVTCSYCGAVNLIEESEPQSSPPPSAPAGQISSRKLNIMIAGVVVVIALLSILPGILASRRQTGATPSHRPVPKHGDVIPPSSRSTAKKRRPPRMRPSQYCLADVNGDGYTDVIGYDDTQGIVVYSGSDGRPIFMKREKYEQGRYFVCLAPQIVGFQHAGFNFTIMKLYMEGNTVKARIKELANLDDRVRGVGDGQGCFVLRTAQGTTLAFDSETLERRDRCRAKIHGHAQLKQTGPHGGVFRFGRIFAHRIKRLNLRHDGILYTLTFRRRGTPLLRLTAKKGRKKLFEEQLPYVPDDYYIGFVVKDGRVVIYANKPENTDEGRVIIVDGTTGKVLHEIAPFKDESSPNRYLSSDSLKYFLVEKGRILVVGGAASVASIDLNTAKVVWKY